MIGSKFFHLMLLVIILDPALSLPYRCQYKSHPCGDIFESNSPRICNTCFMEKLSVDDGKELEANSEVQQVVLDTSFDELPEQICDKFPSIEFLAFDNINIQKLAPKYFKNCFALKMLSGKENDMNLLQDFVFGDCHELEKIKLVNSHISIIERNAFHNLTKLTDLTLGGNFLRVFQNGVFDGLKSLKKLDGSWNEIEKLSDLIFQDLISLERINLERNKLKKIGNSFKDLKNLEALLLQHNRIVEIHPDAFTSLTSLIVLGLANNSITTLDRNQFKNLFNLENLNLGENLLEELPIGWTSDLVKLNSLGLRNNKLKFLSAAMFEGLSKLNYLSLESNPLERVMSDSFTNLNVLIGLSLTDCFCINQHWSAERARNAENRIVYMPLNNTEYDLSLSNCIGCLVPELENGKARNAFLDEDLEAGQFFKGTAQVECDEGFAYLIDIEEENEVSCQVEEWNKKFPQCLKLCPGPQIGYTTETKCFFNGKPVSCDRDQAPGTLVEVSCNIGYKLKENTTGSSLLTCSDEGKWDKEPIKCTPVCGRLSAKSTAYVMGGKDTKVADVPWVAGIYQLIKGEYDHICGGTILTKRIVLSASHCFYNERQKSYHPESLYKIGVGKYYRSLATKEENSQTFNIAELRGNSDYTGYSNYYIADFVILILDGSINFGPHILPICIDLSITFGLETIISAQEVGLVAGWGYTEALGKPSDTLQSIKMPVIDFKECLNSADIGFRSFITPDKYCSGFTNGTGVCQGDKEGWFFLKYKRMARLCTTLKE